MVTKVRKQFYIEAHQETLLKQLAAETGQSEAEIIRAALDNWLEGRMRYHRAQEAWQAEKAFMATRVAEGSPTHKRTWTREDLYEC